MTKHIFKCANCSKYTMKEVCACGSRTLVSRPLKYTPDDRFAPYKRKAKLEDYMKRGLI